jgi:hypothetical protein
MNIGTIQKQKFLTNLYKILYSSGNVPSDHDVRIAFNQYFSVNKPGQPVALDTARLEGSDLTEILPLNELMINSILNLEVLYDCVFENNQEAFSVITGLNSKLDSLRAKRKELESKIDQLLFANANTDGFFYSYLENFSTLNAIDMDLTSAYVDLVNNTVTLPKITSDYRSSGMNGSVNANSIKKSVTFNGGQVVVNAPVNDFDLALDGLNDTYWTHEHQAPAPGLTALTLEVPITSGYAISRITGSLISKSPCSIQIRAIPTAATNPEVIRSKDSKGDFNRFSFSLPVDNYRVIYMTFYKTEPDSIARSNNTPYIYSFGIREMSINSEYYSDSATLVSAPISIPTADNTLLSISAVSMDVKQEVAGGARVKYYVAADKPNATSLAGFNWVQISPNNIDSKETSSVINLLSSPFKEDLINRGDINIYDYELIPLNSESENINQLNPARLPFTEKYVYRVAQLNDAIEYRQPYLLASLNCFRHYNVLSNYSNIDLQLYKSLQQWVDKISSNSNTLNKDVYNNTDSLVSITMNSPSVGFLETKLLVDESKKVSHTISKSRSDFNLSIYLNGTLIADIPSGQLDATVEWSFVKGINNIALAYDKSVAGYVNVDLMVNAKLTDYGILFLDYFSYLDPLDFRRLVDSNANTFTIDKFYGKKELLCSNEVSNKSILRYYSDVAETISAVRYRVDFSRLSNPLETPVLDSLRLKFKHSDI